MDIQTLSDAHVEIESRRPSGVVANDPEKMQELEERKAELWSKRIDEWRGRVARVLNPDF